MARKKIQVMVKVRGRDEYVVNPRILSMPLEQIPPLWREDVRRAQEAAAAARPKPQLHLVRQGEQVPCAQATIEGVQRVQADERRTAEEAHRAKLGAAAETRKVRVEITRITPPPTTARVHIEHITRELRVSCVKSEVFEKPLLPAIYHRGAGAPAAIIEDW